MPAEEKELLPGVSAFPVSRVHKIMKLDKEVTLASKEAIFLISKTTELVIGKLTAGAQTNARMQKREKLVKYQDLVQTVARPEWFYLQDVLPHTIPAEKAKQPKAPKESKTGGTATEAGDALTSWAGNTELAPGAGAVKKSGKKKVVEDEEGADGGSATPEAMQVDA